MSVSSTSTLLEDHCLLLEGLGDRLIARTLSNSSDQKELGNRKMLFYFFLYMWPMVDNQQWIAKLNPSQLLFKSGIRKWWGLNWVPHSLHYYPYPTRLFCSRSLYEALNARVLVLCCWNKLLPLNSLLLSISWEYSLSLSLPPCRNLPTSSSLSPT